MTWEQNVEKCCSLGMNPIIFTSEEKQRCLSNYTKSKFCNGKIFLVKIKLKQTGLQTSTTGQEGFKSVGDAGVGAPAPTLFPWQKTSPGPQINLN